MAVGVYILWVNVIKRVRFLGASMVRRMVLKRRKISMSMALDTR